MKKSAVKHYKAIIERGEDGFYIASVPALPGCHTQAKTLETLRIRLREAIELCLEHAEENANYRARVKALAYDPTFVGFESVAL